MACELQYILNPLDEQDMSAVRALRAIYNATHTTPAAVDTTIALTAAVDGHDKSYQMEVDLDVHAAADILMGMYNASDYETEPEDEPYPENSEKRVDAWISKDGSIKPITGTPTSAIFGFMAARGGLLRGVLRRRF